jgi:1-acyl-sn-glycerol-3-phosphate acyltransferase
MKPGYYLIWKSARIFFRIYFRWRIIGLENVPLTGRAILASNHVSFLDPPLIGAAVPREINYLARESLFRFPIAGSLLRHLNAVPVDREGGGAAGLRVILDRLLAGGAIILFPEGTRSPDGQLQPFRSGIGLTIIKSEAPVIPIRVFGAFEAMSRHHLLPRPHRISIRFGEPLRFERLRAEAQSCSKSRLKEVYREATEQLREAIASIPPPGQ